EVIIIYLMPQSLIIYFKAMLDTIKDVIGTFANVDPSMGTNHLIDFINFTHKLLLDDEKIVVEKKKIALSKIPIFAYIISMNCGSFSIYDARTEPSLYGLMQVHNQIHVWISIISFFYFITLWS
ncbi:hypothetical protein ACJX0J_033918, partial [Zea mays]